jgi:hypothetical protein
MTNQASRYRNQHCRPACQRHQSSGPQEKKQRRPAYEHDGLLQQIPRLHEPAINTKASRLDVANALTQLAALRGCLALQVFAT